MSTDIFNLRHFNLNHLSLRLTENNRLDLRKILDSQRRGISALLVYAGPALVASVAYIDPGNFATNIQAGARYGYGLLWVVVLANLVAMLFQSLSAKLGIVTDQSLPELCRSHFPRPVVWGMWGVSELAAMATELAEFLGGAIGLSLLFHLPLLVGMGVTGLITFAILAMGRAGLRPVELIIGGLIGMVGLCFLCELFIVPVHWGMALQQTLLPQIKDMGALTLTVGIIGATVMPHAIYLHSGLTKRRTTIYNEGDRKSLLHLSNREVIIALSLAGMINLAMVLLASGAFQQGYQSVDKIETAYQLLTPLLGSAAAGYFLVSLIASGLSSSVVGTMAGDMIMQGFMDFKIPVWLRRLITMLPAFGVIGLGIDSTKALVISQVLLSLALPIPMLALLYFTSKKGLMGQFVNRRRTQIIAILGASLVLVLNIVLIVQTFRGT